MLLYNIKNKTMEDLFKLSDYIEKRLQEAKEHVKKIEKRETTNNYLLAYWQGKEMAYEFTLLEVNILISSNIPF